MRGCIEKRRRERQIRRALDPVHGGMSYHEASRKYHVPKPTARNRLQGTLADTIRSKRHAVTHKEEELIVNFILRCADSSTPL